MLRAALELRFDKPLLDNAIEVVEGAKALKIRT
jgi:hypothetical protein